MDIPRKCGKSRQGRATQRQIEALITYLEKYPHVASGKFTSMNSHAQLQGCWEDLTTFLNSLVPNGKEKDVKSWKTTWRDLKSKVSEKVQKLRKGRITTGNNPIDITLSELDKRILGIIGHEYVQGLTGVPDSFPEEQNNAIQELSAGNENILQEIPAPIIIPELDDILNAVTNEDESEQYNENYNDMEENVTDVPHISQESRTQIRPSERKKRRNESELCNENYNVTEQFEINDPCMSQESTTQIGPSERKKRRNSERLGTQLYDARKSFEAIADKHAEAMKVLAEAMKLQADATLQMSNAIDRMARNEERQTQLLEEIYKCLKD